MLGAEGEYWRRKLALHLLEREPSSKLGCSLLYWNSSVFLNNARLRFFSNIPNMKNDTSIQSEFTSRTTESLCNL